MLSDARIAMINMWLVHQSAQSIFPIAERRDNNKKRKEKLINSHQPPISLLLLDYIRLFFKRWHLLRMQRRRDGQFPQIVNQKQSINHHQHTEGRNRALLRVSSRANHATRGEVQCSSWTASYTKMDNWKSDRSLLVHNVRIARWRLWAIGYGESDQIDRSTTNKASSSSSSTNCFSSTSLSFADLIWLSYNSSKTGPRRAISFRGQLYPLAFFFSMNVDASKFFPSNETEIRSTTVEEEEELLCAWLKTDYQLATAKSILQEWSMSTTLSSLTREWSIKHENRSIERNGFSLVLYNISSLRMYLEDLIGYISTSYPNIWTLTGLHSNDEVNYQLVSHFKSRYTIYYQQGSNSFGGVCLAIAREVPHQSTSEVHDANNLIAADVFNSNKKYTVAVVFSPPSEEVPIDILNRLHRYNRNLILIGDLTARHPSWDDVSSNSCGHRLAEWIAGRQDLRIFNSPQPTSTRSQAVIDLIIAPYRISSELAEIDQKMRVTDYYPVHWRLSSFISHSQTECEVKRIDWVVLNCILNLKQNFFFFALSAQMRHDSTGFILVYEAFLVGLQERCTTYRMTQSYRPRLPPYLVNLIQQRRRILCLYRSTRSEEHRNSLFSLNSTSIMNWQRLSELDGKSFALDSSRKIRNGFGTIRRTFSRSERLEFKDFLMRETIECWPKGMPWLITPINITRRLSEKMTRLLRINK